MWFRRRLNGQGGFTLAEIFVAGLIMSFALIPIVRMFDTSFTGIRKLETLADSVNCVKAAVEEIRSMPFYEPHTDSNKNLAVESNRFDIDDRFWGNRSPLNTTYCEGMSVPDWASLPGEAEIEYYSYGAFDGYEDFRVTVQLCYLTDSTGVASMQGYGTPTSDDDWGPAKPGKDRPADNQNIPLHLLLVRVNAYWMDGSTESSYSLETIVTDTEALYNLGLNSITVTGPERVMGTRDNAAAHWSDPESVVNLTIKGYGFDPATIEAFLVRDAHADIAVTLSSVSGTELLGTVNLYSGHNEASNPFAPRADIGYWSVKIRQEGLLSAYLYQGFVVEYPKPVIADFGNNNAGWPAEKSNFGALTVDLKISGGPFVYDVANPTVRLVEAVEDNPEILEGTIVSVAGANNGYTASPGCTIIARFDLSEAKPADYAVEVTNVELELIGHVTCDPDSAGRVYTVTEPPPPEVDTVYVFGTGSSSAYGNLGNPWRLVFEGRYFNGSGAPPVEVWLCESIVADAPAGNRVQGTVVSVPNSNTIIADFDLSSLPYGFYYGFVQNLNSLDVGWTPAASFEVKEFNANIGGFVPDMGYSFYENYYDIKCKVTGNGFLSMSGLFIVDLTTGTEYDLLGSYTPPSSDNEIVVNTLNLIGCDNTHNWVVRLYFGSAHVDRVFDISLGPAKILLPNDDVNHYAISIHRYTYEWWSWVDKGWRYETTAARAQAIRTDYAWYADEGRAYFEVKGMGFPMNGTTYLRVWRGDYAAPSWFRSGDFTCTWDRNAKWVKIVSGNSRATAWSMPNTTGDCGIEVRSSVGGSDIHSTRWLLGNS